MLKMHKRSCVPPCNAVGVDPDRALGPPSPAALVREFHEHVGAPLRTRPAVAVPGAVRRCEFIEEEARELRAAVEAGDLVGVADALGDLLYVVYGAALHFGIDLDAVVQEIHRSNMTKSPAGGAKAVKGPRYRAPALGDLLGEEPADGG